MRKLLVICGPLDYGGAGKIVKFVVNELINRYWDITVYSLRQKERSKDLDARIEFVGKDGPSDKHYPCLHWRIDEILQIRNVVKREQADIVCAFVSDNAFMSRVATLGLRGITFVSAERGDPYTLPGKWPSLISWAYRHSDNCIFQLEKQRDYFGYDVARNSFVVPNPYVPKMGTSLYDGERNKTIVSAGRFDYQKGFDVLIQAFAKVHEQKPDYKLILYGSGSLLEDYVELATRLGVSDYIEFPGYVTNVAEAVRKEGIFVLPSRFEGIPNSLIEAMSAGIPTVSADCTPGGPAFLTKGGERGVLVKVDDVDETADAILDLINNPEKAASYGKQGLSLINELDPLLISAKWSDIFESILIRNK